MPLGVTFTHRGSTFRTDLVPLCRRSAYAALPGVDTNRRRSPGPAWRPCLTWNWATVIHSRPQLAKLESRQAQLPVVRAVSVRSSETAVIQWSGLLRLHLDTPLAGGSQAARPRMTLPLVSTAAQNAAVGHEMADRWWFGSALE